MENNRQQVELVFIGGFHGKSQKGNEYNMTTCYQVVQDKETGKLKAKQLQFFSAAPLDWENYQFGDVVKATIEQPEFLDQSPSLISIDSLVKSSPYSKKA